MMLVASRHFSMQTKFNYENPLNGLGDGHIAPLIVSLINQFKMENSDLFCGKDESTPGSKVKHELTEMLGLYVL